MFSRLQLLSLFTLATMASSVLAAAQVESSPTDAVFQGSPSTSPIAYVYVSSSPSSNTFEINAYAASSNGTLTTVPGSPFATSASALSASSKYLFGTNGIDIDTFSVAADGAVAQVASINAQELNQDSCGGPFDMFLDRTGATLYDMDYIGNICANNPYQSFSVDASSGELNYIGVTAAASPVFETALSFIGNNKFAYGSSCYHFGPQIYGFARNADDSLTSLNINPSMPVAREGDYYCPGGGTADNANHVAIIVAPMSVNTFQPDGLPQVAVYTAESSGNLTTTSTHSNMPPVSVGAYAYMASPSGKYIAVGGNTGLQVFHFNGAQPVTHFTGKLTSDEIDQIFWDDDNHVYAISQPAGKLFVFTVSPTKVTEAPGSPYSITNPASIAVVPR